MSTSAEPCIKKDKDLAARMRTQGSRLKGVVAVLGDTHLSYGSGIYPIQARIEDDAALGDGPVEEVLGQWG